MKFDPEKIKRGVSTYSKKTLDIAVFCGKWTAALSKTSWNIACHYCDLKAKQYKMKQEIFALGKEAYAQWKSNRFFSLQDELNKVKNTETGIVQDYSSIDNLATQIKELCVPGSIGSPAVRSKKESKKNGKMTETAQDDSVQKNVQTAEPNVAKTPDQSTHSTEQNKKIQKKGTKKNGADASVKKEPNKTTAKKTSSSETTKEIPSAAGKSQTRSMKKTTKK